MSSPKSSGTLSGRLPLNSGETYLRSRGIVYHNWTCLLKQEFFKIQPPSYSAKWHQTCEKSFKIISNWGRIQIRRFFIFLFVWLSYSFQLYTPTCTFIFIRITHVIKWDRFDECRLLRKKVIERPLLLWKILLEKYRLE